MTVQTSHQALNVPILRLDDAVELPCYAHPGDAGMDLHAASGAVLKPFERALIPCGFALELPEHTAALVLPRSGLASRSGITVVNSPGLIDSNYRGEIKVALVNLDPQNTFEVSLGDRIAQLLVIPVPPVLLQLADALSDTQRGAQGFGSSGLGATKDA